MSGFVPSDRHLHEVLILLYNMKKSAAEAHKEIVTAYGEQCIKEATCRQRFAQFKKGDYMFKEESGSEANKMHKNA